MKRPTRFNPRNPADPAYNWACFDAQIQDHDLEPMVTVSGAPEWGKRADGLANPSAFSAAAAKRYDGHFQARPRVRYWQAWNEPNHPGQASLKARSPDWYRDLVNRFSAVIHAVDPGNDVIAGGCSPFTTETSMGRLLFMRKLFAQPVTFDIWSHHPYTSGEPTHHANGGDDASLGDMPDMGALLRKEIADHKVVSNRRVLFWVTEFAWDTDPPDPKAVPLALQTCWTAEALYRMWASGVSLVAWWRIRDDPLATSFYQSGLYFRNWQPKRTLYAFRFPFVAFAESGKVFVWGRTPAGKPGSVAIEQPVSGAWRKLGSLHTDRYGIFSQLCATPGEGPLRARLLDAGDVSVPFSLQVPPDHFYYPFGS